MASPPPGPRAKIERAKKHLDDLKAVVSAYHGSNPYTVVREADADGGWIARIEPWPPDIPTDIPLIFGDLIHNLRAALDILICDLVRDHYPQHLGDWTGFPIVKNAKGLKAQVTAKVKGATNAAKQAVIGQQPYKGGNQALWQLHRLDILDKHRLIIPTIAANESVNIGPLMSAQMGKAAEEAGTKPPPAIDLWIKPADPCDDEGGVVFRDKVSPEPNYDLQFKMHVSVHEPGSVECEPIIPLATQMIDAIEAIVLSFDTHFS